MRSAVRSHWSRVMCSPSGNAAALLRNRHNADSPRAAAGAGGTETVTGLVFVGDHCEDDPGELRELAALLGQRSVPLFVFHECADHDERSLQAKPMFKRVAGLSGGVYCEFKPDSGAALREMLANVGAPRRLIPRALNRWRCRKRQKPGNCKRGCCSVPCGS